jgi:hypothetical protein
MAETENYVRLTVEQAMAMYGLDRFGAELVIKYAYPLPERIRPPKVVPLVAGQELSLAGLKERIARNASELIAREAQPDLAWHQTMARIHQEAVR